MSQPSPRPFLLQAPEDGGPGPAGTYRERHRSLLARDIATAIVTAIARDIATRTVIATALRPDIAAGFGPPNFCCDAGKYDRW